MTDGSASTAPARSREPLLQRRRPLVVWTLIVLATLIGFLSMLATWVNRQLLDDANWSTASTKLVQDPAIQSALSVYVVNSLYDNVDVATALEERLPPNLKPLASPVSAALREPASQAVAFLLSRPRVQQQWVSASSSAHDELLDILENRTRKGVDTGNGEVTIDLSLLLKEVGADLGLPPSALTKLPEDAGLITVMRSDQLATGQLAVRTIRVLSIWLVTLSIAMYALAVYLAVGKRREALRSIGWAFVAVGLALLLIRRIGGSYAVNALAQPQYRHAAATTRG